MDPGLYPRPAPAGSGGGGGCGPRPLPQLCPSRVRGTVGSDPGLYPSPALAESGGLRAWTPACTPVLPQPGRRPRAQTQSRALAEGISAERLRSFRGWGCLLKGLGPAPRPLSVAALRLVVGDEWSQTFGTLPVSQEARSHHLCCSRRHGAVSFLLLRPSGSRPGGGVAGERGCGAAADPGPLPQVVVQSGRHPTVLQKLCQLPFQYFSEPRLTKVLFPSLLAACFNNRHNRTILEQEMSCVLLATFVQVPPAAGSGLTRAARPPAADPRPPRAPGGCPRVSVLRN